MGAPSRTHEPRVSELETLAALAGYTEPTALAWRLRPDVVLACPRNGALFLGDAKDTEAPGCMETRARLRWYCIGVASCTRPTVVLALAVSTEAPVRAWQAALVQAARTTGSRVALSRTTVLGDTVVIAGCVRLLA